MYDFSDFTNKLNKIIDHTHQELGLLRTGKATPSLLDSVRVEVYGTTMAVNELANISAPDTNMLVIDPWDKSIIDEIEKAINRAGLNLNPVVDRGIVRIVIPSLTEERRKDLVKQLHQKTESAKMMMRSVRTDAKNEIEDQEGEVGVSEDDIHQEVEELNKSITEYEQKLETMVAEKEKELMSI